MNRATDENAPNWEQADYFGRDPMLRSYMIGQADLEAALVYAGFTERMKRNEDMNKVISAYAIAPPDFFRLARGYFGRRIVSDDLQISIAAHAQIRTCNYLLYSACEHFLKSLFVLHTNQQAPQTHILVDIYNDLDRNVRKAINHQIRKYIPPVEAMYQKNFVLAQDEVEHVFGTLFQRNAWTELRYSDSSRIKEMSEIGSFIWEVSQIEPHLLLVTLGLRDFVHPFWLAQIQKKINTLQPEGTTELFVLHRPKSWT